MRNTDVLIFVEDPGAANYLAQLPAALAGRGWFVKVLADGHAKQHLLQLGVCPEAVQHPAAPVQILASVKPHVLIVGTALNPNTLGLTLVAEARAANIESIGAVDASMNPDHRFRGQSDKPLAYAPDWLFVVDESTKAAYIALGYPAERVVVCGHPHYDYMRTVRMKLENEGQNALRQRVLPGVPKKRKVIIFATECSARLYRLQTGSPVMDGQVHLADYTLVGRGTGNGRTEVVLEEFLDAVQLVKPRPYLVLRLHPKDTSEDYTEYLDEFDLVSSGGSPFELLYAADLVVGLTTMLVLEAALLGKLTLSVVPRVVEMEWLPSVRDGITPCVTTRKQLRVALIDLLCNSSHMPGANVEDVIPFGSLQRVVDFTERLLEWAKTS
jgi:hypothetical protein